MIKAARITVDLALPEGVEVTQEVHDALEALADAMLVQAEDGLYTAGSPDVEAFEVDGEFVDNEFVLNWGTYDNDGRTSYAAKVDIVNLDTESSASRQHYIDTGVFLTEQEVWDDEHADPDRTTDLSGEPVTCPTCLCLFENGVIVRTDDGCVLHSKRPGVTDLILTPEV